MRLNAEWEVQQWHIRNLKLLYYYHLLFDFMRSNQFTECNIANCQQWPVSIAYGTADLTSNDGDQYLIIILHIYCLLYAL